MSAVTTAPAADGMGDATLPDAARRRARLRALLAFVRPHRKLFVLSVATASIATLGGTTVPFLFKHAIDEGIVNGDPQSLWLWSGLALALGVLVWGVTVANQLLSIWSVRVLNDLQVALFAHVQKQGMSFFTRNRTGTVISRLTNDIEALSSLVTDGVFMVFFNVLTLVLIEAYLFAMDWRLALAVNVVFPVMIAATAVFRVHSTRTYRMVRERMALVTAFLAEHLAGMRVVQAFAAEGRAAQQFEETNEHYREMNMRTIHQSALYFPGVDLLSTLGTAVVLYAGGMLEQRNLVTVGVLFAFIAYLNEFFDPIQQLSQFYGNYLSASAALDKIMGVLETEPDVVDRDDALVLDEVRGELRFEHVSFAYTEGGTEVLHDVDFAVQPGETIALVGETGAGKSTIVRLLTRFHDPTSGRVLLDGHDLRDLDSSWLRGTLGIVPQEGFLFSGSVADNIRFGRPGASDADVRAAAEAIGADDFITKLPDEYDTAIGERGTSLSSGQRQMIAFARALLADPTLLILDEATSSVDVATEQRLADGLGTLVAGRTSIIVAHRLTTIRGADRILVIHDGDLVEQGTHDELVALGGRYADLHGTWSRPATVEECLEPQA